MHHAENKNFKLIPQMAARDKRAAIYYGHLTAQIEISLPGVHQDKITALSWLVAHIAIEQDRLWTATFDGLTSSGIDIGSWRLSARLKLGSATPIGLERQAWLQREGTEVIAQAEPFFLDTKPEEAEAKILDLAAMQAIDVLRQTQTKILIRDQFGTEILLKAVRVDKIQQFREKMKCLISRACKFFR